MNVFELFGKIAIDGSGAMSGIDQTVGHAKKAENSLSKIFKTIGGVVAAAFSVRTVVNFGRACTEVFASIAAEESAFAQVMGDYADTAQAKLNAVADQTGITSTRMTGAMTSLTAKFKGLGYSTEDATTLATDSLLIAADAAAFWDMSLDESVSHLNSFINGNYEAGEAIGIFATDSQMAAYAVEKGIVKDVKAWSQLDEATKQATRLDYARNMQQQSGVVGQASKEADAYANVMANLKEAWRQFQGVIGKPILEKIVLPAMQKLNAFMPKLTESVQNGILWLEEGFGKIKEYFSEVFTEDGINMDAFPDAVSKMFKDAGRKVGGWLSGFGKKLQDGWNNTVWPAIQALASTFGVELPDIDLGKIFESGSEALQNIINIASTFFTDVKNAFAKDENGKIQLNAALSGLFDAGITAISNLLGAAGTLVTDIIGVITGNEEGAEKIGKVFSDLFGVAGEVVIGVKDNVVGIFDWFLQNGNLVAPIITAVAVAVGQFALANPAIAAITALTALITVLSVDWAEFESNYPELVAMFEDLTGMDFTNVATSLDGFKTAFEGLVDWFKKNEVMIDTMIMMMGGLIFFTNPVAGAAMIAYGAGDLWEAEGIQKDYARDLQETGVPAVIQDPFINNSDSFIDWAGIWRWLASSPGAGSTEDNDGAGNAENNDGAKRVDDPITEGTVPYSVGRRPAIMGRHDIDLAKITGKSSIPATIAAAIQTGLADFAAEVRSAVAEGAAEGVGSIEIKGTVSTGDVKLNTGALVGQLAPRLDLRLGAAAARAGRG